jgi:uncharacterized NAD-dependent epimerase/dehydratase family protein
MTALDPSTTDPSTNDRPVSGHPVSGHPVTDRSGDRLAVLTGGLLHDLHAKTAHGVLRYGARDVVCVIDEAHAGRSVLDIAPFCDRDVPVLASVREAHDLGATVLLVGVAPSGGKLAPAWRAALLEAVELGMHIEAGLHTALADDEVLAAAARARRVQVRDLRSEPADLDVPKGPAHRPAARVVLSVGTDCAIGKMSVTLELDREARRQGLASVFVATGQTGIAISGWGIAVDHVISDYTAGAAEQLVHQGAARGDLLWIEGQGSLFHPAYSGVTLGLLHGSSPDLLVLCHRAGLTSIDGYPETPVPPLADAVRAYESAVSWVRPARVGAIALNTAGLDEPAARAAIDQAEAETGLVADDVVRFGPQRVLAALLAALG